jgi:hypothetical protein
MTIIQIKARECWKKNDVAKYVVDFFFLGCSNVVDKFFYGSLLSFRAEPYHRSFEPHHQFFEVTVL